MMILRLFACKAPTPLQESKQNSEDTDTGSYPPDTVAPPAWMSFSEHFSVEADRGLAWERDPDFSIDSYTVPQIFMAPDGRFAMFATWHLVTDDDWRARQVMYSEDGLNWTEPEPFLFPEQWPLDCGSRFSDGAVWLQHEGTWRYVMEGKTELFDEKGPHMLCDATTTDGVNYAFDDKQFYTINNGETSISVPAFISRADDSALFYFNSLIDGVSAIWVSTVDPETSEVSVLPKPILTGLNVDPMPVYVMGGGLRLYHTWSDNLIQSGGIGYTTTHDGLYTADQSALLIPDTGVCDKVPVGECLMDPAFLRLSDGRLVLYFTAPIFSEDGGFTPAIKRAFATD